MGDYAEEYNEIDQLGLSRVYDILNELAGSIDSLSSIVSSQSLKIVELEQKIQTLKETKKGNL